MYKDVVEKLAELVTTAFGLVAALAWNSAIQGFFEQQETLKAGGPFVYAVIVTLVAVLATVWIGRVASRAGKRPESE